MSNITIATLRNDVLDRIDNEVITTSMPEGLRQKIVATKRVTQAMNNALAIFISKADPVALKGFVKSVNLTANATVGGVTTYLWPSDAVDTRPDSGLIKIDLDGEEISITPSTNTDLQSLRYRASSSLYGVNIKSFHVDIAGRRIYAPSGLTTKAVIIESPLQIMDSNLYSSAGTVPISQNQFSVLSDLTVADLKKSATNIPTPSEPKTQEVVDG